MTAHDGFTLADLVAYNEKKNLANGEDNRWGRRAEGKKPASWRRRRCEPGAPRLRRPSQPGLHGPLPPPRSTPSGTSRAPPRAARRDGEAHNLSWNCGEEGPSSSPLVNSLRQRQMRNMMTALLVAHGVPMLYMGDEYGHR